MALVILLKQIATVDGTDDGGVEFNPKTDGLVASPFNPIIFDEL